LAQHPAGVIFSGTKGAGKTSALRGLEALFKGAGIGPDSIHFDHDKAKLRLDFTNGGEALQLLRTIGQRKTAAELNRSDGSAVPRAMDQMRALFGDGSLDPMRLWKLEPKDLRRAILDAIPCQLTAEDLTRWCEGTPEGGWSTAGNGHDVLAGVREAKARERAKAKERAEDLETRARAARETATKLKPAQLVDITPDAARTHVTAAERDLAVLAERRRAAAQRESAAAETRQKVAELRAKAEQTINSPGAGVAHRLLRDHDLTKVEADCEEARGTVEAARQALEKAEHDLADLEQIASGLRAAATCLKEVEQESASLMARAAELEAALEQPADEDLSGRLVAAEQARNEAIALVANAEASAKWREAAHAAKQADDEHRRARDEATQLDRIVKRLTADAVAELASRSDAIPGLEVTADDILYLRRPIGLLSDGEKLEFAVDVAKRVQTGAKVLLVDGLEALPPRLQPAFVRKCLGGGWILFATRVADGGLQVLDCFQFSQEAA